MKKQFNISQHPRANGFERKVLLLGPVINLLQDEVVCNLELQHFENGVESDSYIKKSTIKLKTNKEKFVDLSGQRVVKDENGVLPEGSISEWDFLFNYVSPVPNQSLGNTIIEVIEFMVQRNDANGNFNDLSNFD